MKSSIFFVSVLLALAFAVSALGQSERNKYRLLVLSDIDGDPDNDNLTYLWMYYPEPGTYGERHDLNAVRIADSGAMKTTLTIPGDAETGDTIHIVLMVTDNGDLPLIRYRRIIIHVTA